MGREIAGADVVDGWPTVLPVRQIGTGVHDLGA